MKNLVKKLTNRIFKKLEKMWKSKLQFLLLTLLLDKSSSYVRGPIGLGLCGCTVFVYGPQ